MTENTGKQKGHIHPITQITNEIVKVFVDQGFEVAIGPEIESEYYNFDVLNVPKDHPSRDMQDTFWLKPEDSRKLLRTHTSSVQIHYMENNEPPFKIVAPGKVFRNEATDVTHEAQFHQIEGLVVGEDITFANLKNALEIFIKKLFGEDIEIKLRPGFFPFVEPGVEIDMMLKDSDSKLANKWIEVMGAGMVHPNVLRDAGIDSEKYSGFAFGMGIDRLAVMKYGINDVRDLYTGDLRFVNQF